MDDEYNYPVGSIQFRAEPPVTYTPVPVLYRLARKPGGETVLQGAYGYDIDSLEWVDIPTVDLGEGKNDDS